MCGVGKTLISLWITQQLHSDTIIVGVPNILLLEQWENVIRDLFPTMPILIVSGGVNENDIQIFLETYKNSCIVITTYASSHKVKIASQHCKFKFSMKILDKVHHLTSHDMQIANTKKTYIQMLNIDAVRQIALTATLKQLEIINNNDEIT